MEEGHEETGESQWMLTPGRLCGLLCVSIAYRAPPAIRTEITSHTSIDFEALRGQAHYVSVGQPQWGGLKDPALTVRSEGEALPALKKMKPVP